MPTYDGPTLRAVRENMGVPLRRVARLAGMSHGHLSKVERGEYGRPVTPAIVHAYEQVCHVNLGEAAVSPWREDRVELVDPNTGELACRLAYRDAVVLAFEIEQACARVLAAQHLRKILERPQPLAVTFGAIASYATARDVPAAPGGVLRRRGVRRRLPAGAGDCRPGPVRGRGGTLLQPGIRLLERAADFPANGPILVITDG